MIRMSYVPGKCWFRSYFLKDPCLTLFCVRRKERRTFSLAFLYLNLFRSLSPQYSFVAEPTTEFWDLLTVFLSFPFGNRFRF